jgi:hypothetical protein
MVAADMASGDGETVPGILALTERAGAVSDAIDARALGQIAGAIADPRFLLGLVRTRYFGWNVR